MLIITICILALAVAVLLVVPTLRYRRFFDRIDFVSYDNRLPRYIGAFSKSRYLRCLLFRSKIPLSRWQKIMPDFELFCNRKVFGVASSTENMRRIEVLLITRPLPSLIEWNNSMMLDGARFAIGVNYLEKEVWDAEKLPHGLVAGATGGGKTALLRLIIHQAILKRWNVSIIDFKRSGDFAEQEKQLATYRDLEEGYGSLIISEPEDVRNLLLALVVEVRGRLEEFRREGVSNITEYNATGHGHFVPWLIVIDEAAEVFDVKPADKAQKELYTEIDHYLRTLARISRAAGVHLLIGFIRPSSDVLDGQIKNNLLWRACSYLPDPAASRIVLDNELACKLPPEIKGRFIIGENEVQTYFLPTNPRPPCESKAGGGCRGIVLPSATSVPCTTERRR